jgi:hypothetical protein
MSPYRDAAEMPPQFVCTVCFSTATVREAGTCSCSGVQRLPLDNPEVAELVRARVEKIRSRRTAWKVAASVGGAVVIALGVCLALGLSIDPSRGGSLRGSTTWFTGLAFGLCVLFFVVASKTEKKPPTDVQGLLRWLRVKIVA